MARQNLSGADKTAFYARCPFVAPPHSAFEPRGTNGTDTAAAFQSMMRGLVQEGGMGQQAAELIASATLQPNERADLISELSRRWVRSDPEAAIAWANSLSAPEDFRAAIPLLVSQLDNERVGRTVETFLENPDPTMELALIEAAAPPGLMFDPEKSRLILNPLISQDPSLQLTAREEHRLQQGRNDVGFRQSNGPTPGGSGSAGCGDGMARHTSIRQPERLCQGSAQCFQRLEHQVRNRGDGVASDLHAASGDQGGLGTNSIALIQTPRPAGPMLTATPEMKCWGWRRYSLPLRNWQRLRRTATAVPPLLFLELRSREIYTPESTPYRLPVKAQKSERHSSLP
jgi:hypothetical protein